MNRNNYHTIKKLKIGLIILFLLLISLPIIDWIVPYDMSMKYNDIENRKLASRPEFNLDNISDFPNEFETYFNDNVNFRENLLTLNAHLGLKQITPKSSAFVHRGKDGWCFVNKYIKAFENKNIFTEVQIDSLVDVYKKRGEWLKRNGIASYIAVVPSKANLYPEYLPDYIFQYQKLSRTEQLLKVLEDNENIKGIDLKESLLQAKKKYPEYPLYYKTDQHWNDFGAFIGFKQIMDTICKDFPEFEKVYLEDYNITIDTIEGMQLAKILKSEKTYLDKKITLTPKIAPEDTVQLRYNPKKHSPHPNFPYRGLYILDFDNSNQKPKILLIRDSYSNALLDRFKEGSGIGDIVLVWDNWCYQLNDKIAMIEKPKVHLTILIDANIPIILSLYPNNRRNKK